VLGLTVYADESGIHDKHGLQLGSEITAIAGYISTKRNWEIVIRRWNTALTKFGVEVFHMSEYWRNKPPYDKWSDAKKKKFLSTLIRIARDNTWFAIAGMVPTKDWDDALPEDIKGGGLGGELSFDHPYHFCFQMFFARFMDLLTSETDKRFAKHRFKEKVAFVFEQQHQFEDIASAGFHILKDVLDPANRLASLTFGSKEDYIPLQAADLLAFYARRILTHQMQGKAWRDPFERQMEERHNLMLYYFTREQLIEFARKGIAVKQARAAMTEGAAL
jgi:Protein of unknown function (DUF3800)